ncbi:PEP-CTERM sorting domain-containing protein [Luteolibacter pohnpeiensis]|uniref:PEP-CTERM sorting domain-containing protein n=1 Tax=Luteolibacter pohnpeiensis TaxID=454153 RepID=A0A934VRP3_9BACT|nr:PEP-CTERM sorting domain-containing protein [Luteolibacter pohnpeiensis]MBK1883431.1 PEP-CTERM sorting domain-containing protein [Luteolibacter pohnpeiensis]
MKSKSLLTLVLSPILLSGTAFAAYTPVGVTGWTEDIVINNPSPYNESVTSTMDGGYGTPENNTWIEAGTYTRNEGDEFYFNGLVAGTHTSIGPSGAEFVFQNFTGNNALLLESGITQTLSLDSLASYSSLVFIGAAAGGGAAEVTVTLHFSDFTTATFSSPDGIARDWFDSGSTEAAYLVGGRASNKSEEGYTLLFDNNNDAIRLHEYVVDLALADQSKELVSIDVTNSGSGGRVALFAVSGEAIPEPSVALLSGAALLGLGLRRRRN